MFNCSNLLHPFQNDPGTSQRQRIIDQLLSDAVKIDARTLADLLNFFSGLSAGINFYDKDLSISTWKPFFSKSLPFLMAALSRYDDSSIRDKFEFYKNVFGKQSSVQGLQLMISFILYNTFGKIDTWYKDVRGSGLPIETSIEELIRTRLTAHLITFISLVNTASKWFCIKKPDFTRFLNTADSDVWNLEIVNLYAIDNRFNLKAIGRCELLRILYKEVSGLLPTLLEGLKQVVAPAEASMMDSLVPQVKELQENHPPHLALVFAFISLFQKLQGELNKKTKEHLEFFYIQVLKIKPAQPEADRVHVIFEIQKLLEEQYEKFKIDSGTKLLAGRDEKNSDILFETNEEIVVNEAQVADLRTLFLKYEHVNKSDYLEGVYIAPNAVKADGVEKDFKDGEPVSWFTLGNDKSKYVPPLKKSYQKHPPARLGFVLASPVLYLSEGQRTVSINLKCKLQDDICESNYKATDLYLPVVNFLVNSTNTPKGYITISKDLLDAASSQGMNDESIRLIRDQYLMHDKNICTGIASYKESKHEEYSDWLKFLSLNPSIEAQVLVLPDLFKEQFPLNVYFSGEKEWIIPRFDRISLLPIGSNKFDLTLDLTIPADMPPVTFYNSGNLKEEIGTGLPVVKIEIDDSLKFEFTTQSSQDPECCLNFAVSNITDVSVYSFFRYVKILKTSKIDVKVCGLKNLIVQNDESVQDVNSPIYPFGTRPRVGASFYIGSKELFSKDWREIYINAEWKDKPKDFAVHYKHYSYKDTTFEDGSKEIVNSSFLTTAYVLEKRVWIPNHKRRLFKIGTELPRTKPLPPGFPTVPSTPEVQAGFCSHGSMNENEDVYDYTFGKFPGLSAYERRQDLFDPLLPYSVSSQYGFIRFTLEGVSFQHDIFPFVLARHMMAYAGLLTLDVIQELVVKADQAKVIITEMISKINDINDHMGHIQNDITLLSNELLKVKDDITRAQNNLTSIPIDITQAINDIVNARVHADEISKLISRPGLHNDINDELDLILSDLKNTTGVFNPNNPASYGLTRLASELKKIIEYFVDNLKVDPELKDGLPSEPYTPVIKALSLDYTAVANGTDIDLIHLYPFTGTFKAEKITLEPTLFPTFCDEGTLFIGFKDLVPGSNLSMLFQLAEATSDSESEPQKIQWHYLSNNLWKILRSGFEVLNDSTEELTTSGIIKLALPENMSTRHTIMPDNMHWIKASALRNSRSVSETIGIHTQAVTATFVLNENTDTARLTNALEPGKIEKLLIAEPNIKGVVQPYESFGSRLPELESSYYLRVSEQLRHKGRAIQKWDYERLLLEEFPVIYKAKCISHSFQTNANFYRNDIPYAPGYVILAVIPDLRTLKAGNSFEPKVPVSILNRIETYFRRRTSPFVGLRAINPRYEKVHFCITVRLNQGVDEKYYSEKLKSDIAEFLAPWAVGKYDKLTFGQCVYRSDIIRFLERSGYVDFIIRMEMKHENDPGPFTVLPGVCPESPRSILIAGNIDIIIDPQRCDVWCAGKPRRIQCNQYHLINDYCNPMAEPVEPPPPPAPQPPIN